MYFVIKQHDLKNAVLHSVTQGHTKDLEETTCI